MARNKVAHRNGKAERMTAEEARSFGTFSVGNAVAVKMARPCGCEPYRDVFTFRRWIAQGFVVRKGEKAIRINVKAETEEKDKETGEKVPAVRWTGANVFCRCQVKPLGDEPKSASAEASTAEEQPIGLIASMRQVPEHVGADAEIDDLRTAKLPEVVFEVRGPGGMVVGELDADAKRIERPTGANIGFRRLAKDLPKVGPGWESRGRPSAIDHRNNRVPNRTREHYYVPCAEHCPPGTTADGLKGALLATLEPMTYKADICKACDTLTLANLQAYASESKPYRLAIPGYNGAAYYVKAA